MLVIKPVNIRFSLFICLFFKIRKRKIKIQIVDNFSVYNLVIIFLFLIRRCFDEPIEVKENQTRSGNKDPTITESGR